jgi:hypothetical protein
VAESRAVSKRTRTTLSGRGCDPGAAISTGRMVATPNSRESRKRRVEAGAAPVILRMVRELRPEKVHQLFLPIWGRERYRRSGGWPGRGLPRRDACDAELSAEKKHIWPQMNADEHG